MFNKFLINFLVFVSIISCSKIEPKEKRLEGNVFGTRFHIIYISNEPNDFSNKIDSLFVAVNQSLSTYIKTSDISRINSGESNVVVDSYFKEVFKKSKRIYKETNGTFDPTIGVLVNAWGFGPGSELEGITEKKVDSLMKFVGFDKVVLSENKLTKQYPEIYLDFNAIAKGYGIDVVSRFIEAQGVTDYMVEIGGEVRVRGKNSESNLWRIGIEKPNFDGTRSLQEIVKLNNESMATSGNYRKFRIDTLTGERYVHTIDTKTGFPAKRDLLSASVIASLDCADVDGYATAFMAMGYHQTKEFLKKHKELKVFLIFLDEEGETQTYSNIEI